MTEKIRYSDEELEEFRQIILERLEKSKKIYEEYNVLKVRLKNLLNSDYSKYFELEDVISNPDYKEAYLKFKAWYLEEYRLEDINLTDIDFEDIKEEFMDNFLAQEFEEFENICSKKSVAVAGPSPIVFTLNGTAANIYNLISSADSAGNYIHYALAYMMEDIETKTTTIYKIPTYYKIGKDGITKVEY